MEKSQKMAAKKCRKVAGGGPENKCRIAGGESLENWKRTAMEL